MNKDLDALRLKAGKLMNQIRDIEQSAEYERAKHLLGKCYRYSNSYGSDTRWWLYRRVTAVDKRGWLTLFDFQHCTDNRFEIRPAHTCISPDGLGEPITLKQFQQAWKVYARMLDDRSLQAKARVP
jgi:hypothetical protein